MKNKKNILYLTIALFEQNPSLHKGGCAVQVAGQTDARHSPLLTQTMLYL